MTCHCGLTFADLELLALHKQARHPKGPKQERPRPAPSGNRPKHKWVTNEEVRTLADEFRPKK